MMRRVRHIRVHRSEAGEDLESLGMATWDRLGWTKPDYGAEDVRALNRGQWALLVLDSLDAQVGNGGFSQLFFNQPELAQDAPAAAELVGADDHARVAREALALLPSGRVEEEAVDALLADEAAGERLEELDSAFFALGDGATRFAGAFAARNPELFFLSDDEARADIDDLIARLRAAAGDVPRASANDVAEAEQRLGRAVPPLLARLYTEVGDGGWGPDLGLLPLSDAAGWWEWARRELHGTEPWHVWQPDVLPLARATDGLLCADFSDPLPEVREFDPAAPPHWSSFDLMPGPILPFRASLRAWLETWLR